MNPVNIQKHLNILGYRIKDKITLMEGVAQSVCFDLYGCIQVCINLGIDKDGKLKDSYWLDVNRIEIISETRVMEPPSFEFGQVAEGNHGPANKPAKY